VVEPYKVLIKPMAERRGFNPTVPKSVFPGRRPWELHDFGGLDHNSDAAATFKARKGKQYLWGKFSLKN